MIVVINGVDRIMIINLKPLFAGEVNQIAISESFDFSQECFAGVYPLIAPVETTGFIESRADLVTIDALSKAIYHGQCDRCGCDINNAYDIKTLRDIVTMAHTDENDELIVLPDMQLNLGELVFSEIVLNLPMKHLCKEDCKGVCGKCGSNLNCSECGCVQTDIDPRLAALQELLK